MSCEHTHGGTAGTAGGGKQHGGHAGTARTNSEHGGKEEPDPTARDFYQCLNEYSDGSELLRRICYGHAAPRLTYTVHTILRATYDTLVNCTATLVTGCALGTTHTCHTYNPTY